MHGAVLCPDGPRQCRPLASPTTSSPIPLALVLGGHKGDTQGAFLSSSPTGFLTFKFSCICFGKNRSSPTSFLKEGGGKQHLTPLHPQPRTSGQSGKGERTRETGPSWLWSGDEGAYGVAGRAGQEERKGGEAGAGPRTYSRSSKLDFLSSALWGMSLKNRLEREKPGRG